MRVCRLRELLIPCLHVFVPIGAINRYMSSFRSVLKLLCRKCYSKFTSEHSVANSPQIFA